ncbi:probable disease resistance protein At4g27220 isoform X2 [Mangifera indica]|uniref:probable disease resistance protein At4g27220 isoform X2 n=1 Tax=Mangifera indica TaxID=29780 RepID=UPI001CF9591C|nr:probable disease resistance protein At4g27220 isoform X2 [Mangifera indica]
MAEEIVTSTAAQLASKATESAYDLFKQQISYVFKSQSYISNLENQVQELRMKKERVEKSVESAERQGEEIHNDVKNWLRAADDFTEREAKAIIEDGDKANKGGCLKLKSCPNLIQRYKLGKEAVKATVTGADLLGKGSFSSVSYRPALQRTESMYVRGYEAFDSREQVLQEILDTLKDANFNMVGVHGMGGVGKTTLVNKVAWQVKEDRIFHEVAIAEVTQTPDYKKIQEKLASDLGLEFCQESEYQRASQLRSRIKKEKSLLIILDNIWTKLDLDAIGIPFGDAEKGGKDDLFGDAQKERKDDEIRRCTILLTSRYQDVLSKDMKTQKNIFVRPISKDDAWNLFRKIVGDSAESSDFHPLADEFVTKCAGLPVAISTIANTLKNESLPFWKDALVRLKRSTPRHIPDMEESVYSTIELSYNFLKIEEAKSLFLLCALKDGGSSMSIGDLLKYSMGLNLFEDVYTLEEGRNRLNSLINYLKAYCLLLDGDNDHAVKMHDIIHDVAVSIASTEKFMFNIQNVIGLNEVLREKIPKDSIAISLPYRDIYDKLPQQLEFSKLKLFFLLMKNRSLQIPDAFFEEMKELRVLNLTGFQFFSLPSSISSLKNLKTLCLHACLLEDLRILGELSKLEILSFLGSDIEQLPAEIGQLTQLKILDLSNCINLKYVAPQVISCLSQLEELYMGNCFIQWEVEGVDNQRRRNASLEELKQLSNLTALHLHLQDARGMPQDFFFEKLKSYHLFIGDKWKWSDKYYSSTSRTFKLKISDNVYLGQGIKSLLEMTEDLFLEEMNGLRYVVCELNADGFPHLKHLHVEDGLDILYIINSVAWKVAFPKLESLILCNLIKLEKICHGQLNAVSFSKLRIIKIEKCDRLEYLFASFMAKNLMQLQEIEVTYCKNLKELFGEESDNRGDEIETNNKMEFNQLCSLALQCLPKFIMIDSNMVVVFPRLENLKLRSINIENTWLDRPLSIFSYSHCLKSLSIEECHGLNYLFSSAMVKSLNELQKLVISNCKSMEVIVDSKGVQGEETIMDMSFPKLLHMKLEHLPELTNFGIGNLIEFPSLKELHIEGCSNLKTFLCKSSHPDTVREEGEVNLENYFMNINPLFDEKVAFPSLEEMVLSHLYNLQLIWHNQKLHGESFCKLKVVRVLFCDKLLTIVPSNTQGNLSFRYLKELTVVACRSMKSLFPVSTATSLVQLESLDIHFCGLEKIVSEEEVMGAPTFLFPQLKSFYLFHLKELKYFYPQLHTIEWPMLSRWGLSGCKKIKVHDFEFSSFQERDEEKQPPIFYLEKVGYRNFEHLTLSEFPNMKEKIWNGQLPNNFFENLKSLVVDKFLDISTGISSNVLRCFKNLELLKVKSCQSLEQVFDLEESHQEISGLQKLKSLKINNCNSLRSIFTPAILLGLVQLQEVKVKNCALIEEIIKKEEEKDGVSDKIIIPQLNSVMLESLPSLTSFYSGRNILECPPLETIIIKDCQKVQMKEFNIHLAAFFTERVEIPALGSSSCFQNLTILHIGGFEHLKYLFPSSMLKSFFKLRVLEISNCMFMEKVIDEDEGRARTMLFPKLYQLKLRDLPKLTTFCNSTASFVEMSSLFKLRIDNCLGIQTFISSSRCGDMTSSSKDPEGMNAKEDYPRAISF